MNKKKRDKLVEDLKVLFLENGFKETPYGAFQKTRPDGSVIRYKFTKIGLRKEAQKVFSDGTKHWSRLRSGYLKDLYINENRQIVGMTA